MSKPPGTPKKTGERINEVQMQNLRTFAAYTTQKCRTTTRGTGSCRQVEKFISDNFYECPPEALGCLGQMYVTDERFTAYYDKFAPGLASYYNDAIQYYCTKK